MSMIALATIAVVMSAPQVGEEWPQWRGPRGDGTWVGPAWPERWPEQGPRVVWKQTIGGGYAGLTTAQGRLYVMDYHPDAERKSGLERLTCYDYRTGKVLWQHDTPVTYGNLGGYANGPRAAPVVHEGRVYTLGAIGQIYCFHAETGAIHWQRDGVKDLGGVVPMWGYAGAPLIHEDKLIVHLGAKPNGCVIALDRLTGKEIWRSIEDEAGYCNTVLAKTPSGLQLIQWSPNHIHGLDPNTGEHYWKIPYKVTYGVSIATPIVLDDLVFVTGYWHGSKAVRLGAKPTDATLAWEDERNLRGLMAQPFAIGEHVYTLDKQFGLTCFEWKTGKKHWDDENSLTPPGRNPHASILRLQGTNRILALNSAGELVLGRVSPEGYSEDARAKVLQGKTWSHPAVAGRWLFARTDGAEAWQNRKENELVCIEIIPE